MCAEIWLHENSTRIMAACRACYLILDAINIRFKRCADNGKGNTGSLYTWGDYKF